MARPADFRVGRGENEMTNLRPPAAYEFTIATDTVKRVLLGNFPFAFTVLADRDVYVGYTNEGVTAANRFRVVAETRERREVTTPALYIANYSGDTATVNVDFELSQVAVPDGWGEISQDNGFDGGDVSNAVEDVT